MNKFWFATIVLMFIFAVNTGAQTTKVPAAKLTLLPAEYEITVAVNAQGVSLVGISPTPTYPAADESSFRAFLNDQFGVKNPTPLNSKREYPKIIIRLTDDEDILALVNAVKLVRVSDKAVVELQTASRDVRLITSRKMTEKELNTVKPNPLTLVLEMTEEKNLTLNNEQMGKLSDTSSLVKFLKDIYREREVNGVFRANSNDVEKTVFIKMPMTGKAADLIKIAKALQEAGADIIGFQVDETAVERRELLLDIPVIPPKEKAIQMKQYHDLLRHILDTGVRHEDRTGTGTISAFGYQTRFSLSEGFPIVTTKRVPFRWIAEELFWFLSGSTDEKELNDRGVDIWAEWATVEQAARFDRQEGDLGPVYGYLWRSFGGDYPQMNGVDQIARLIKEIEANPNSRRLIVSGWDPRVCDDVALPPCHTLFQFKIENETILHCQLYQRSADGFLGVPFNISSYALLTHLVAYICGLEVGDFIHTFGDLHIYSNHVEQVNELLTREPMPLPKLEFIDANSLKGLDGLLNFKFENLKLNNYQSWGKIAAPVAV